MFDIVASNYMRDYLKGKREFTDWEKATLIWNNPMHTWRERLDSLKELAITTKDEALKCQIGERINHEERVYQQFITNQNNSYIYVLLDDMDYPCGYFKDYEVAKQYGIKYCEKNEDILKYYIEKPVLFTEVAEDIVDKTWTLASYNPQGEICSFFAYEISDEEKENLNVMNKKRFENSFFSFPFEMKEGTIVKMVNNGKYAVLEKGVRAWTEYMEIADASSFLDYTDIQVVVYEINENGHWFHTHVNPLYLEPELPEVEDGNKKEEAYKDAIIALSIYFQNETKENLRNAKKASGVYADMCAAHESTGGEKDALCDW